MSFKMIVLATILGLVSASSVGSTSSTVVDKPNDAAKAVVTEPTLTDPFFEAAYDFHKGSLIATQSKAPYHYTMGCDVHDRTTRLTKSQYEKRTGDVAEGVYVVRAYNGSRTVVDYIVDTPKGFIGVVRSVFTGRLETSDYSRRAAPLAYASHPSHEVYETTMILYPDPDSVKKANNLTQNVYNVHNGFVAHFKMEAPFRYTFGYEVKDVEIDRTRSHYETYDGEFGEGSFVQVEADGSQTSVHYIFTGQGFSAAAVPKP